MLSKVMTRSRASVQISDSQFVPQCVLGHDICNRWKIVARPGLEPRAFLLTVRTLYHWATEPPGHLTNNFSLELYPFTHFPGHFKFVHEFPVGKSTISYILPRRTYRLNHLSTVGFLCWEAFELPSHPVISPTTFHLNPTRLHIPISYEYEKVI